LLCSCRRYCCLVVAWGVCNEEVKGLQQRRVQQQLQLLLKSPHDAMSLVGYGDTALCLHGGALLLVKHLLVSAQVLLLHGHVHICISKRLG
jgi:hypothetical protein